MKNFRGTCACASGGIGICLCTVFMSFGIVSSAVVGVAKNANDMSNMGNMTGMTMTSQNIIVTFFSGFWGEVILFLSFGAMFSGIWFSGNRKILPISAAGAIILYVSMYAYFSISLEIIGGIVLAFAFVSAYSNRVARTIKLA
ncbi:MAG: hypothetical protein ACREBI_11680 [Nitrosotalea sp.]